ncbi:HlyD family efflux transporter periplasmic adaptor subunit [Parasalinivibrio latis]|uniref:HlyD family efflux transporter periplasmic adaptor subunit n=1 Tax=Parasalinivibrio latis TaxID=2952610 RepID=UPI0030E59634
MGAQPQSNSIHTFQSRTGARRYPRIEFPASINIAGKRYPTKEWSIGGFSLNEGDFPGQKGEKLDGDLCFELPIGTFSTPVHFEVMRASDNGYIIGCQFFSIDSNHQKTLQTIVDTYLSGETLSLDSITTFGVKAQLHEEESARMKQNWWRFTFVALGAAFLIAFGAMMVQSRVLTIKSFHAAVTQPVLIFRSHSTGIITFNQLELGKKVSKGEPVFQVETEESADLLAEYKEQLASTRADIAFYDTMLKQISAALGNYKNRLNSELGLIDDRLSLILNEERSRVDIFERFEQGKNAGSVDHVTHEYQWLDVLEVRKEKLELISRKQNIENQLELANFELLTENGFTTMASPFELSAQRDARIKKAVALELEIERIKNRGIAYSPCDCYVIAANATEGEVVETGNSVLELSPVNPANNSQRMLVALMPVEKASLLKVGMEVDYRLTSNDEPMKGTILETRFYSAANPLLFNDEGKLLGGLPQTLPRLKQYTLLLISPSEQDTESVIHEPATVLAHVKWQDFLTDWLRL